MSARGKRRGARKDSTAKKAKVTSESQSNVAVDEFEFQSTGKVKEPNRFVDFEAVLRASDIPLPLSSPQPPVQSVSHSTTTPIPDAVQIIPSVLGQSIEQLRCSGQAIGGCTYATVFSSKKWRTLEDEPHQREKFAR